MLRGAKSSGFFFEVFYGYYPSTRACTHALFLPLAFGSGLAIRFLFVM